MERLYSRRRYLGETRKFEEYKRLSRRNLRKKIRKEEVRQVEKRNEKQKAVEIKLNPEAEDFKRSELPERYTARILFGWDNNKF